MGMMVSAMVPRSLRALSTLRATAGSMPPPASSAALRAYLAALVPTTMTS